jgi:Domain of unknown function (DUF1918)
MHANVGDRIVIKGYRLGEHERDGEVLEVRGKDGAPPYLVRWSDDGHTALFFPGGGAVIQPLDEQVNSGG